MANRYSVLLVVLTVVTASVCEVQAERVGLLSVREFTTAATTNGVQRLLDIERSLLPPTLEVGAASQSELPQYYWSANPTLESRFEAAKQAYRSGRKDYQALTLVAGAAGVGKTFLKGRVFDKDVPKQDVYKVDLHELYQEWNSAGVTAAKPDLACDDVTLNHLLSVVDKQKSQVLEHLRSQHASFYVIDALDEVHPDDYPWLMEQLKALAFHGQQAFVHIVVFGRDPAVLDCWSDSFDGENDHDVCLLRLEAPRLRTIGDWTVSSWNYHCWKYHLRWSPNGGDAESMPLAVYNQWAESGFPVQGPFQTVSVDTNQSTRADVQRVIRDWMQRYRVPVSTIGNLAGNSIIREVLEQEILAGHGYDERRVMEAFLYRWMTRDTKACDRPSVDKPEYLSLYVMLLEQLATQVLQDGQLDDAGFFPVSGEDVVSVTYDGRELSFSTKALLDRSGLIQLDVDASKANRKYRFEPIWMHRLLVEMQQAATADEGDRLAGPLVHP